MASIVSITQGSVPPVSSSPVLHLCRSSGGITNIKLVEWITPFDELCETLLRPPPVGKKDGSYFVKGALKSGCTTRSDASIGRVDLAVLDGDSSIDPKTGQISQGAPPPLDTHIALIELGIPHVLYSTHSDGQEGKGRRYRVLVPTPDLAPDSLDAIIAWIFDGLHKAGCHLADVPENHRLSQPWFFPRVPDDRSEYLCYASESGQGLDTEKVLEWHESEQPFTAPRLVEASRTSAFHPPDSLFAQFNTEHDMAWMEECLHANDYLKVSTTRINNHEAYRYLSPHSTSGQAGIMLFRGNDGVSRVYSHHGSAEPLTKSGEEVSTSDAWDLYRIFHHGGDQQAAIAARQAEPSCKALALPKKTELQVIVNIEDAISLDFNQFPNIGLTAAGRKFLPATIANVRHLLNGYSIQARYNVIGKREDLLIPGLVGCPDNADNSAMTHAVSLAILNGISHGQVPYYVAAIADTNQYNPVVEYISRTDWDKVDRLEEIYATLTVTAEYPEEQKRILLRRWMISAVAAAYMPTGFRARGVLVLQGAQSIGKTSFFLSLVDDPALRDALIKINHCMDAGDKDSIVTAVSHWIVEFGELDSSFKRDIARLKGFITDNVDKVRRPYGRTNSYYPRRTVFCASVNSDNFLVDDTGNSRWWTIPVTDVNFDHGLDMQQVWAQVLTLYRAGEQWWLTREEETILEELNRGHRAVNAVRDCLETSLDFSLPDSDWQLMTATEVLKAAGFDHPTNPQTRDCGSYLRDKAGEPTKSKGKTRWRVPLKKSEYFL